MGIFRRVPRKGIPKIRKVKKNEVIAKCLGDFFPAQLEKVYVEMGGKPFLAAAAIDEHLRSGPQRKPADPRKGIAGR